MPGVIIQTPQENCAHAIRKAPRDPSRDSGNNAIASVARRAISEFVQRTSIRPGVQQRNPVLEARLQDELNAWDRSGVPVAICKKYMNVGLDFATTSFAYFDSTDIQFHIAIIITCFLLFDDAAMDLSALKDFPVLFHTGQKQRHPILERYAETVRGMAQFYEPFAANCIASSVVQFVNMENFDREIGSGMPLSLEALPYIWYKRAKTGFSEAVSFWLWPQDKFPDIRKYVQAVPDTWVYIDMVNDILSWYKEALAEEACNYISDVASATGKSPEDILLETVDKVVACVKRARTLLGEGTKEREVWEKFVSGYITFHLACPRYRLSELTIPGLL